MGEIKQTENEVKKAIKQYLELKGYVVDRINNGGIYRGKNKDGNSRFSFAGSAGVADLYATKDDDCPIWIEVKATGKKPTVSQLAFGERINKTLGTFWIWADSLDMFMENRLTYQSNIAMIIYGNFKRKVT